MNVPFTRKKSALRKYIKDSLYFSCALCITSLSFAESSALTFEEIKNELTSSVNNVSSCLATYNTDEQALHIPCVKVADSEINYAVILKQETQIEPFQFVISNLEQSDDAHLNSCQAVYNTGTGVLDIPCLNSAGVVEGNHTYLKFNTTTNTFSYLNPTRRYPSNETTSFYNSSRCNAPTTAEKQDYCSTVNPFKQSGYGGQCTAHAWGRAYAEFGIKLKLNGKYPSAKYWWDGTAVDTATGDALEKGTVIRANSIAIWGGTTYGHVAYVQAVKDGKVIFTENNYYNAQNSGYGSGYKQVEELSIREFENRGSLKILGYIYLQDTPVEIYDFWKKGDQNDPIYPDQNDTANAFDAQFKLKNKSDKSRTLDGIALAVRKADGTELDDMKLWGKTTLQPGETFETGKVKTPFYIVPGTYFVVAKAKSGNKWTDLAIASFVVQDPKIVAAPVSSDVGNVFDDFRATVTTNDIQTFLEKYSGDLKNKNLGGSLDLDANNFSDSIKAISEWNLVDIANGVKSKSPAEIIYLAAKENSINPVLLLAKIQQEQSLITQSATQHKLNRATGYGIPNSNPAGDPKYASFLAQTTGLTYQFDKFRTEGKNIRQAYDIYTVDNTGQDASYDRFESIYLSYKAVMEGILNANNSSSPVLTEIDKANLIFDAFENKSTYFPKSGYLSTYSEYSTKPSPTGYVFRIYSTTGKPSALAYNVNDQYVYYIIGSSGLKRLFGLETLNSNTVLCGNGCW